MRPAVAGSGLARNTCMAKLNCPGCGTPLSETEGDEPQRCLGCTGEYVEVSLTLGDLFGLVADAEDGPEKDWYADRLAELAADEVVAEAGEG